MFDPMLVFVNIGVPLISVTLSPSTSPSRVGFPSNSAVFDPSNTLSFILIFTIFKGLAEILAVVLIG